MNVLTSGDEETLARLLARPTFYLHEASLRRVSWSEDKERKVLLRIIFKLGEEILQETFKEKHLVHCMCVVLEIKLNTTKELSHHQLIPA